MTTDPPNDVVLAALRARSTDAMAKRRALHDSRQEQRQSPNIDWVLDDSFPASDPPPWSGAISHVAPISNVDHGLVQQIEAEFQEMPGLRLTIEQAQRLWCLEPRTCHAVLKSLIDAGVLRRTKRGLFVLRREGR